MHTSGSVIKTIVERIRMALDLAEVQGKYLDDYLVRHVIMPATVDVLGRINMTADNPVRCRFSVELVAASEFYQLPPGVDRIWRVEVRNANNDVVQDFKPRSEYHPAGPGWAIEGNMLAVRPKWLGGGNTFDIIYSPSSDILPVYGAGGSLSEDRLTFTLGTPSLGAYDRRPNAYGGMVLRLIPETGPIEERVIGSHSVADDSVTVLVPFETGNSWGSSSSSETPVLAFEVVPVIHQHLMDAIATRAALRLAGPRNVSNNQYQRLIVEYRSAVKTAGDNLANLQARTGDRFDGDVVDSPETAGLWLGD